MPSWIGAAQDAVNNVTSGAQNVEDTISDAIPGADDAQRAGEDTRDAINNVVGGAVDTVVNEGLAGGGGLSARLDEAQALPGNVADAVASAPEAVGRGIGAGLSGLGGGFAEGTGLDRIIPLAALATAAYFVAEQLGLLD